MNTTTEKLSVRSFFGELSTQAKQFYLSTFVYQLGYLAQIYLVVYMIAVDFSEIEAGLGLTVFCTASMLGTVSSTLIADRIGVKSTVIFSAIAMMVATAVLPILVIPQNNIVTWVSAIAVSGYFSQMYRVPAITIMTNLLPEGMAVMGFSSFRIALNIGGSLGPIVATYLIGLDWSYVFWFNSVCCFVYAIIALLTFSEPPKHESDKAAGVEGKFKNSWKTVLGDTKYWLFLVAMFLSSMVYIQYTATLPIAINANGLGLELYSGMLVVSGLVLILFELKISSITGRFAHWLPSTVGTSLLCISVASFGVTLNFQYGIIISAVFMVVGLMISGPIMFAYPATFPSEVKSKYIAANQIAFSLGNALGPLIGLALYNRMESLVWISCGVAAIICGIFLIFGMRTTIEPTPSIENI